MIMEYKIFYGDSAHHFVSCAPGTSVASGQPNQETYSDEGQAIARVLELKSDFFPTWDREQLYVIGDRVKFGNCIFRALQDNDFSQFMIPDTEFDADTEIPTPMNRQARWQMVCNPEFEQLTDEEESY